MESLHPNTGITRSSWTSVNEQEVVLNSQADGVDLLSVTRTDCEKTRDYSVTNDVHGTTNSQVPRDVCVPVDLEVGLRSDQTCQGACAFDVEVVCDCCRGLRDDATVDDERPSGGGIHAVGCVDDCDHAGERGDVGDPELAVDRNVTAKTSTDIHHESAITSCVAVTVEGDSHHTVGVELKDVSCSIRPDREVLRSHSPSVLTSNPVITHSRRGSVVTIISVETNRGFKPRSAW